MMGGGCLRGCADLRHSASRRRRASAFRVEPAPVLTDLLATAGGECAYTQQEGFRLRSETRWRAEGNAWLWSRWACWPCWGRRLRRQLSRPPGPCAGCTSLTATPMAGGSQASRAAAAPLACTTWTAVGWPRLARIPMPRTRFPMCRPAGTGSASTRSAISRPPPARPSWKWSRAVPAAPTSASSAATSPGSPGTT